MRKIPTTQNQTLSLQDNASSKRGRVFEFSLKGIDSVNTNTWAKMKAAARKAPKSRHYPEIIDASETAS